MEGERLSKKIDDRAGSAGVPACSLPTQVIYGNGQASPPARYKAGHVWDRAGGAACSLPTQVIIGNAPGGDACGPRNVALN